GFRQAAASDALEFELHLQGHERVSAAFEEIILRANRRVLERVAEQGEQLRLESACGGRVRGRLRTRSVHPEQRGHLSALNFAGRTLRYLFERQDPLG